ncbi:MAG: flippase-like domain-containing protein [Chloroflexi bacterium]|nr:flippase-like domain-containing protein [Chloroflexota bacterium]MCI0576134.1 flippase-like domain-containing protein [Chloroflexota bacterium]MCI0647922.1 flippase-like domain-containing protein [Chloroflexota bacterium]MCI0727173.1 flippase-like domain-containing protein [Chloroflexota bacterium]
MRKRLTTVLKVGVTLAGLIIVLQQVELDGIADKLVNVQWSWLLVAFILATVSLVLRAYRWHLLLRGLGVSLPFGRLVELYFVGNFFNAFLLSGFGGDAVRILEVAQDVPANVAAGTVIVDRLTGLLMLFAMALVALPFRPPGFPETLLLIVTITSIAGLVGGFILLDGRLLRRFGRWLPAKLSPVGDGPVARLLQAVQGCGWRALWGAMAISVLFNLLLVAWWATTGWALGYDVPYSYYLLVVPILSVALLVPSVSGLGVRESLAPPLFAGAGLDPEGAFALAFLVFIVMRLSSLLGAPVYIASLVRRHRNRTLAQSFDQPIQAKPHE